MKFCLFADVLVFKTILVECRDQFHAVNETVVCELVATAIFGKYVYCLRFSVFEVWGGIDNHS